MYIVKMNTIPKLKCCFFETFEAEINEKNKELFLKSKKTGKEIKIKLQPVNYLLFSSGKFLFGVLLLLIGLYNYYPILGLNNILMLFLFWSIIGFIASLNKNIDEDLILFVSYAISAIFLYFAENTLGGFLDFLTINTFFFISANFIVKGIKEYRFDRYSTAVSVDEKFIFKIKKIKKEI